MVPFISHQGCISGPAMHKVIFSSTFPRWLVISCLNRCKNSFMLEIAKCTSSLLQNVTIGMSLVSFAVYLHHLFLTESAVLLSEETFLVLPLNFLVIQTHKSCYEVSWMCRKTVTIHYYKRSVYCRKYTVAKSCLHKQDL